MEKHNLFIYSLSSINNILRRKISYEFKKDNVNLTVEEYIILAYYDSIHNKKTNLALTVTRKEKTILSKITKKLIEKNFLIKKQNLIDRRRNEINFTKKGLINYRKAVVLIKTMADKLEIDNPGITDAFIIINTYLINQPFNDEI